MLLSTPIIVFGYMDLALKIFTGIIRLLEGRDMAGSIPTDRHKADGSKVGWCVDAW